MVDHDIWNIHLTAPSLIAGVLSGIAGLLVFLVIHHLWIAPIWFILPLGLVIASLGGLATGWAYAELLPGFPPRPWRSLALVALIGVILLPSFILTELREPLFTMTGTDVVLSVGVRHAVVVFVLELLAAATITGMVALTLAFVLVRWQTPSDGAPLARYGVQAGGKVGVSVTPWLESPNQLRSDDTIAAIAGTGLETWARRLVAPSAPHPTWQFGQMVV